MSGRVILKKRARPAVSIPPEVLVTCPGGAEHALAGELERLGFDEPRIESAAVRAGTNPSAGAARANFQLRTASRVLIPLLRSNASTFDEVYAAVVALPWEAILPADRTFAITATTRSTEMANHRYVAMRVKDGIVDRQRRVLGRRSSVDRNDPDLSVVVFLQDGDLQVSLDSSGAPLHERGYRVEAVDAPLRETTAGFLLETVGASFGYLLDPFCGSGTIAIEAALAADGRGPGTLGRAFAWQRWDWLRDSVPHLESSGETGPSRRHDVRIVASDGDPGAVEIARRNARRAGVDDRITFRVQDAADSIAASASEVTGAREAVVVTNPPYGERLDPPELEAIYRRFAQAAKRHAPGWTLW
jgi:23S rRNA G2445 N2-methylase RlmL